MFAKTKMIKIDHYKDDTTTTPVMVNIDHVSSVSPSKYGAKVHILNEDSYLEHVGRFEDFVDKLNNAFDSFYNGKLWVEVDTQNTGPIICMND